MHPGKLVFVTGTLAGGEKLAGQNSGCVLTSELKFTLQEGIDGQNWWKSLKQVKNQYNFEA